MRLAGVIILYNPTEKALQNVLALLPTIDFLYVFDNTEKPAANVKQLLKSNIKIYYSGDGSNLGIAARLNQAISMADAKGYKWLLTMDQDSFFEGSMLNDYINCVNNYEQLDKVAMFGVEFERPATAQSEKCAPIPVNRLITSGSILNIEICKAIGSFNEDYFIDCVDTEYCFRAITKGFSIVKLENILLNHSLGKVTLHRSFLTFKITPRTFHSPLRIYYMIRNFLLLSKTYKENFNTDIKQIKQSIIIRIKNIVLYSNTRFKLLSFILKAYKDFKHRRFGKYVE